MLATERIRHCVDLDLGFAMRLMRQFHTQDEITEALDSLPRDVLDSWRDRMELIPVPRATNKAF